MEIEFAAAWKHFQDNKQPTVDPSEIEELFKVWDKEGKGEIKFDDLAQCLKIFGKLSGDNFTDEEATAAPPTISFTYSTILSLCSQHRRC